MVMPRISVIAAIGKNRELGRENKLLWHIPDDLERFKRLTAGHPVIMGRKTFDSILGYLGKPLPNRTNIVVTRNPSKWRGLTSPLDIVVVTSVEDALEKARTETTKEIFIIGGAQIYEAALPHTNKLYLTIIDDEKDADSFFPPYESEFTRKVYEEEREWNGLKYTWVDLERA